MDDDPALANLRPPVAKYARWAAAGAVALVVAWSTTSLVRRALRPRAAHLPRPVHVYTPPFGVQREAVARIDLGRVHAELFPRWVLAESEAPGSANAQARLAELRAEAGKDPSLDALLTSLAQATGQVASEDRATRFVDGVGDWNRYLDRAGAPWHLEPTVRSVKHRQTLYVKAYRVVSDVTANVGATPCRARFLRREDRLNVIEPYLGQTTSHEEGAFVVMDRIRELGEGQVWPLLDEANDAKLAPTEAPFAASVRGEAARSLPADAFRALSTTAVARLRLVKLAHDVDARSRCGSDFHLGAVPSAGFSTPVLELARLAVVPAEMPCPSLTDEELSVLLADSHALAEEPALGLALEALDAWLASAVATHELRHAADGGLDGFATPCPACPPSLGPTGRAELSAYVTALATDGVANVALFQACTSALVGPSRDAVAVLASTILPNGCAGAPPADLVARAGAAEEKWFSRRERVAWTTPPLGGGRGNGSAPGQHPLVSKARMGQASSTPKERLASSQGAFAALRGLVTPPHFDPREPAAAAVPYAPARRGIPPLADVYLPDGRGPHPSIVLVHGGGFLVGSRGMKPMRYLATRLAEAGFAAVSIDYRMIFRGGRLDTSVEDVRTAVRWWREQAARFGLDTGRTAMMGLSAGATLTMLAADALPSTAVDRLVCVFGAYDFAALEGRRAGLVRRLLLESDDPGEWTRRSPMEASLSVRQQVLLIHGTGDELVPVEHTRRLADRRQSLGLPVETRYIDGAPHAFFNEARFEGAAVQALDAAVAFLRR